MGRNGRRDLFLRFSQFVYTRCYDEAEPKKRKAEEANLDPEAIQGPDSLDELKEWIEGPIVTFNLKPKKTFEPPYVGNKKDR
jgi:hypothetical protein